MSSTMSMMDGAFNSYAPQRQRQLEEQVQTLLGQVTTLEAKLGDLHATDVSSLRRAYKSLAQHVQALDVETKHLPSLLDRATEASVTPDFVAKQAQLLAAVTAAVFGTGRLLRTLRVAEAGPITARLAILGFCYAGVRLAAATVQRLGATDWRRQRAHAELRSDLRAVRERVQVMADLVESGLKLHRLHPSQQQSLVSLQQTPQQQEQMLPPPPPPPPPPEWWSQQRQLPYQQWQAPQQQPQQQASLPLGSDVGAWGGDRTGTPSRASAVGVDDGW